MPALPFQPVGSGAWKNGPQRLASSSGRAVPSVGPVAPHCTEAASRCTRIAYCGLRIVPRGGAVRSSGSQIEDFKFQMFTLKPLGWMDGCGRLGRFCQGGAWRSQEGAILNLRSALRAALSGDALSFDTAMMEEAFRSRGRGIRRFTIQNTSRPAAGRCCAGKSWRWSCGFCRRDQVWLSRFRNRETRVGEEICRYGDLRGRG